MTDTELKELTPDISIDARGTACPGPLLAAKKGMAKVAKGEILEVLSTDEGTNKDIPMWAKKRKHEMLGILEDSGYWRLYLKRGR